MSGYVAGFWSGFVVMTYSTVQHRLFIQTCYRISLFDNFIKLKQSALILQVCCIFISCGFIFINGVDKMHRKEKAKGRRAKKSLGK